MYLKGNKNLKGNFKFEQLRNEKSNLFVYDIPNHIYKNKQLKEFEEKLHFSQKQECLTRMAGAMAHNLNNILGIILGNAGLALSDNTFQQPKGKFIKNIIKAAERAKKLSEEMLIYSGKMIFDIQNIYMLKLIMEIVPVCRILILI